MTPRRNRIEKLYLHIDKILSPYDILQELMLDYKQRMANIPQTNHHLWAPRSDYFRTLAHQISMVIQQEKYKLDWQTNPSILSACEKTIRIKISRLFSSPEFISHSTDTHLFMEYIKDFFIFFPNYVLPTKEFDIITTLDEKPYVCGFANFINITALVSNLKDMSGYEIPTEEEDFYRPRALLSKRLLRDLCNDNILVTQQIVQELLLYIQEPSFFTYGLTLLIELIPYIGEEQMPEVAQQLQFLSFVHTENVELANAVADLRKTHLLEPQMKDVSFSTFSPTMTSDSDAEVEEDDEVKKIIALPPGPSFDEKSPLKSTSGESQFNENFTEPTVDLNDLIACDIQSLKWNMPPANFEFHEDIRSLDINLTDLMAACQVDSPPLSPDSYVNYLSLLAQQVKKPSELSLQQTLECFYDLTGNWLACGNDMLYADNAMEKFMAILEEKHRCYFMCRVLSPKIAEGCETSIDGLIVLTMLSQCSIACFSLACTESEKLAKLSDLVGELSEEKCTSSSFANRG